MNDNTIHHIIGAGIAGLTTAIALQLKGIPYQIHEASPELRPAGAGIILANNAMQVFRKLGIYDELVEAGNRISELRITTHKNQTLSNVALRKFEEEYGVHNIAIHRGELQKVLAKHIDPNHLHLNRRLKSISKTESQYKLDFENGDAENAEIVIGSDGIHSRVREQMIQRGTIRSAGQLCWRGIVDYELPDETKHRAQEMWGPGSRIGIVPISENRVYWFALVNIKPGEKYSGDFNEAFHQFSTFAKDILQATPPENILENEILDLKPFKGWHNNKLGLIGDAAHATTPNMGQGACQAIEDAYQIAELLNKNEAPQAFGLLETQRRKKVHRIVKTSWQIGKMAQLENPILIALRNTILKMTPSSTQEKQLDRIFKSI